MSLKRCTQCGLLMPVDKFTKNKGTKDGLFTQCKECVKIKRKESQGKTDPTYKWGRRNM